MIFATVQKQKVKSMFGAAIFRGCTSIVVRHVYQEANSISNWIATYIVEHSGDLLWTDMKEVPGHFRDILFSDFLGYIHTRII